jgi:transcriptional regulator with XRE-family HTH domain
MAASEDPSELFHWLENVRGTWGWSQKELAKACRLTPNQLRNYRDGQKPGEARLAMIASAVGVPLTALHRVMAGEDVVIPPRPPRPALVPNGTAELAERLDHLEELVTTLMELVVRQRRS